MCSASVSASTSSMSTQMRFIAGLCSGVLSKLLFRRLPLPGGFCRGSFGHGFKGRIVVEEPSAAFAWQEISPAHLIPHLGTEGHLACKAALSLDARQTGSAARSRDTVEGGQ